jgi:hypothetical protein
MDAQIAREKTLIEKIDGLYQTTRLLASRLEELAKDLGAVQRCIGIEQVDHAADEKPLPKY